MPIWMPYCLPVVAAFLLWLFWYDLRAGLKEARREARGAAHEGDTPADAEQSAMSIPPAFTRTAEEPAVEETAATVADIMRVYQRLQGYRAHTYAECRWLLQQEQASEAVDGQTEHTGENL